MRSRKFIFGLPLWRVALSCLLLCSSLVACKQKPAPPPPPVPEVSVMTVTARKITLTTELPGRIAVFRIAEIRPQANGLILKRLFVEGGDVKAGQVLYEIDPAPFQAALENAKAAFGRAEANVPAIRLRAQRFNDLLADNAVSQQDYDDASAALKQVEADVAYWKATVRSAEINLGYTTVKAPISGRIGKTNVTEGAIVTAYQPVQLASIQQLDPIYVDASQATAELLRLKRRLADGRLNQNGSDQGKVQLMLEDNTVYPFQGVFQFRDVSVDPTTGSVMVRIAFPNPEMALLPGMFVRVVVKEGIKDAAILIPQQTVVRDPKGNPMVLTVSAEGKVEQIKVILDRCIEDQWLIASGLEPGDKIIVEGIQKARPGTVVRIAQAGNTSKTAEPTPNTANTGKSN